MMPYVALFLVGAGGWFLAAAFFRYHGYIWLDQTCNGIPYVCDHPAIVALATVVAVAFFFVLSIIEF